MVGMQNLSRAGEWRGHWKLVLAAAIGLSYGSVSAYSIGLFIEPLADEFGWSRVEISGGMSLAALLSVPLAPILGILIDRFGSRYLAVFGVVGTGLCFVMFSLITGSLAQWLGLWVLYAFLSLGSNSTVWGRPYPASSLRAALWRWG